MLCLAKVAFPCLWQQVPGLRLARRAEELVSGFGVSSDRRLYDRRSTTKAAQRFNRTMYLVQRDPWAPCLVNFQDLWLGSLGLCKTIDRQLQDVKSSGSGVTGHRGRRQHVKKWSHIWYMRRNWPNVSRECASQTMELQLRGPKPQGLKPLNLFYLTYRAKQDTLRRSMSRTHSSSTRSP